MHFDKNLIEQCNNDGVCTVEIGDEITTSMQIEKA